MIETLETLIKLTQQELNECRQNIKVLQEKIDGFQRKIMEINKNIEKEKAYLDTIDAQLVYNNYVAAAKMKRENTQHAIHALNQNVEELKLQMQEHFATLKKYEMLAEREQSNLKRKLDKKLQEEMDEISLTLHSNGE